MMSTSSLHPAKWQLVLNFKKRWGIGHWALGMGHWALVLSLVVGAASRREVLALAIKRLPYSLIIFEFC
ncbi:hypothetical protein [Nostoc sp. NOS(2021)]|uniref:hypothetical protein n=1 Tax=Nostoc sp. NOS(2021) TaxID=2815407 RepID=UPI0025EFBA7C|nr:hypothetical protein [Nostoc sp. NOS(2021)]